MCLLVFAAMRTLGFGAHLELQGPRRTAAAVRKKKRCQKKNLQTQLVSAMASD
jgi:hypothetical protein